MKKICILLAVYEGEKYLTEQLNSILNQKKVDFDLYISVDLSSDKSLSLCESFSKNYNNVILLPYESKRYGCAAQNFLRLLLNVDVKKYSFISFSDQDDIWKPFKLFKALKILSDKSISAYSSNVQPFNSQGLLSFKNKTQSQKKYDYLIEGGGAGSTYVLRTEELLDFIDIIKNSPKKLHIYHHDWIIYFYFRSHNKKWFFDDCKNVLYRQHTSNEIGSNYSIRSHYKRFLSLYNGYWFNQTKLYLDIFDKNSQFTKNLLRKGVISYFFFIINVFNLRRSKIDSFKLLLASIFLIFNYRKIFRD